MTTKDDSAKCEQLCLREQKYGCCSVFPEFGCYWKDGAVASTGGQNGLAVTCIAGNMKTA